LEAKEAYPNGSLWENTLVTLTGPRLALSLWDLNLIVLNLLMTWYNNCSFSKENGM
jgi:hypothetical protein